MKPFLHIGIFIMLMTGLACSSAKSTATPEEIAAMEKMISSKQFEISANWAQPMASQSINSIAAAGMLPPGSTASRIDISSTGGYLRMMGDSVKADLPYFGERQMGGGYNSNNTGINFEGVPKDLSVEPNKKGTGKTIQFNIENGSEGFQVIAQLYPGGTARLTISSSQRDNIWYQGVYSEYKKEEE